MKNSKQTVLTMPKKPLAVKDAQKVSALDYQPVFKLSDELLFLAYCFCQLLPHKYKDIGEDLKNNLSELATLIHKTKATDEKIPLLEEACACLGVIRLRICLLYGFNQLSPEQYTVLTEHTDEISAQLAAWKRSVKKRIA
jgi:hypothetical protein